MNRGGGYFKTEIESIFGGKHFLNECLRYLNRLPVKKIKTVRGRPINSYEKSAIYRIEIYNTIYRAGKTRKEAAELYDAINQNKLQRIFEHIELNRYESNFIKAVKSGLPFMSAYIVFSFIGESVEAHLLEDWESSLGSVHTLPQIVGTGQFFLIINLGVIIGRVCGEMQKTGRK